MWRHPERDEYVAVIKMAARDSGLPPAIKRKLTMFAKRAHIVVYGADSYGGACCPLKAVGVERTRWDGPWNVDGGYKFQRAYDRAMMRLVGMPSPCAVSVASRDQEQTK